MTDTEFLSDFLADRLDPAGFRHAEHVRAAFLLLRTLPLSDAIPRYAAALRAIAARAGAPEKYHETITVAFLAAISDRMSRSDARDWARFRDGNPDLMNKAWIGGLYTSEELADPAARRWYREPLARRQRRRAWLAWLRAGFAGLCAAGAGLALFGLGGAADFGHLLVIGAELAGAALFPMARTRLVGAALLLAAFAGAEVIHLAAGGFRFAYPLYALGLLGLLVAESPIRSGLPRAP